MQIDYLQDNKRLLLSELVKEMQSKWQAFKKWLANGGQNNLYKIKKPLKINRLTTVIVPFTVPFSNSFYQNLTDIYALKELLYNEGIADYNGLPLIKPDNSNTLLLPQGY